MEELQSLGQQRFHSGVTRGCTGPSGLPWPLLCPPEQEVTSSVSHSACSSIPHQQGLPTNPPLQITNTAQHSPCRAVPGATTPCSLPAGAGSSIPKGSLGSSQAGQCPIFPPLALACPSCCPSSSPAHRHGLHTMGRLMPGTDIQHSPLSSFFQAPMKHFL